MEVERQLEAREGMHPARGVIQAGIVHNRHIGQWVSLIGMCWEACQLEGSEADDDIVSPLIFLPCEVVKRHAVTTAATMLFSIYIFHNSPGKYSSKPGSHSW
jgi:hypothetical protein